MIILQNADDFKAYVDQAPVLLIEIGSKTCAPCGAIQNRIELWHQAHPESQYLYIPVEQFRNLCAQLGIFSVPVVLVYVQGKLTLRECGFFGLNELLSKVEYYLHILQN